MKHDRHFIQVAMKNKMAARDLCYVLGLPSYDNLKGAKLKNRGRSSFLLQGWFWQTMHEEWFNFQQKLMVSKILVQALR